MYSPLVENMNSDCHYRHKQTKILYCLLVLFILSFGLIQSVSANNLTISNVSFGDRDPANDKVVIKFDISWENSWKTKINHDAAWLTVRLNNSSVSPANKKLCSLTSSGLNPTGTSVGSNIGIELYVPTDKRGVFVQPKNYGVQNSISSTGVQLTVDYSSCGFSDSDSVNASVFGLEMVFVPEGAFYAGDQGVSTASLVEGSSDSDPWYISSNDNISVSNPLSNGYRYVSAGLAQEDSTGATFSIAEDFPKGYAAFYVMKYEITEGEWVEFINSLPTAEARESHDITDSTHKNSDSVEKRNTVSCSGSPLTCSTDRPSRALGFLSWMDVAAFLDWAALRPMTELEFEKAARGPIFPNQGEFAWGSADIAPASTLSGSSEDGTETVTTVSANANYNNTVLSGGDAANGPEYTQGPLRSGIFAVSGSTRASSGAGYYGMMDLSGNISERIVTIGNATGRAFQGSNGDGYLTSLSGFEGNANELDWPGLDSVPSKGVTGALGSGVRGGSFSDVSSKLSISDRSNAADSSSSSSNSTGGRGARTYDGT